MVRHGHLDVPVIGVARAGRTNEHLKERVRESIQQAGRRNRSTTLGQPAEVASRRRRDYENLGPSTQLKKTLGSARRPAHHLAIPPAARGSVMTVFGCAIPDSRRKMSRRRATLPRQAVECARVALRVCIDRSNSLRIQCAPACRSGRFHRRAETFCGRSASLTRMARRWFLRM